MKKLFIILCFIQFSFTGIAQQFTISVDKMNVVYIGILNPITPIVENVPCKDLIIETNNGTIIKGDEPCQLFIMPTIYEKTVIKVYAKTGQGKKLIGERDFRTKRIPKPTVSVGAKSHGTIKRAALTVQMGLIVGNDFDIDDHYDINSYRVSIIRNQNTIFEKVNMGVRFNDDTEKALQTIKVGDKFICSDIRFSGMGYKNDLTNSIELTVID